MGQWWLGAAGLRKDDSPGDFYVSLQKYGNDSSALAPTSEDQSYRRFERAYAAELEAERAAKRQLIEAVLGAIAAPDSSYSFALWGADVTVRIVRPAADDDVGRVVIELAFERWNQRDRFPYDLLALVPFVGEPDGWDYLPAFAADVSETWYTYVAPEWIDWFATTVELEHLEHRLGEVAGPMSPSATEASHYVSRRAIVAGMVESVEIRALCGHRFVPYRDPTRFPTCESCIELRDLLRTLASSE